MRAGKIDLANALANGKSGFFDKSSRRLAFSRQTSGLAAGSAVRSCARHPRFVYRRDFCMQSHRFFAPALLFITAFLWSLGGVLIKSVEWNSLAIAGMSVRWP